MIPTEICNRQTVVRFLCNELDLDEKLDFLDHLQECKQCWTEVYNARKNEHPHYYKKTTRRLKVTDKELAQLNGAASSEPETDRGDLSAGLNSRLRDLISS